MCHGLEYLGFVEHFPKTGRRQHTVSEKVITLKVEAIVEAGLTAKSGTTETILKQIRPAANMALTCGTTFTDQLGKMVEGKQLMVVHTKRCFPGMQPKKLWRVCNYMCLAKDNSTRLPGFGKEAPHLGILVEPLESS